MVKYINSGICLGLASAFLLNMQIVSAAQSKLVLGTKIDKHVMQNEKEHFAFHDGKVCAQIALQPSHDGKVTFVWTRDGHPYTEFTTVTKQSARYRTHACVTARPGKWHVVVKDADKVLAERSFVVDGDAAPKQDKPKLIASVVAEKVVKAEKPKTDKPKMDKPKDVVAPVEADKAKASGIGEALKAIEPTDSEKLAAAQKAATTQKPAADSNVAEKSAPTVDSVKPVEAKSGAAKSDVKVVEPAKDSTKK
jgi:hypothetical protein